MPADDQQARRRRLSGLRLEARRVAEQAELKPGPRRRAGGADDQEAPENDDDRAGDAHPSRVAGVYRIGWGAPCGKLAQPTGASVERSFAATPPLEIVIRPRPTTTER